MNDFISLKDLSSSDLQLLLTISGQVKRFPGHFRTLLTGKSVVLLFEKPSLRTRLTFDLGMAQLGGSAVALEMRDGRIDGRESLYDVSKNLERWFDAVVARTFSHAVVEGLAKFASIPVINALTDDEHPCQAAADLFTLRERWGTLTGKTLAFVGDGNNVCVSLMHGTALAGMSFKAITPEGHRPPDSAFEDFRSLSATPDASCIWSSRLEDVSGADAVYTDTWVSMGQEAESGERMETFGPYQVTEDLLKRTGKEPFFMHCLPAHRNQEVVDPVIDSGQSLVFDQAENRLHIQKALLLLLLAQKEVTRYLHLSKWTAVH